MKQIKNQKITCLLIHGYLGTPFEMEPLAGPLRALGCEVLLPTLPGHDSNIGEFKKNNFDTWSRFMEQEYDKAQAQCDKVVPIGLSLGGTFALHLAERREPAAVVALDAPVFPCHAWPGQAADWARLFLPLVRKFSKNPVLQPWDSSSYSIAPWRGYEKVVHPVQQLNMLKGFLRTRKGLGKVSAPLLVMHDARDRAVRPENSLYIIKNVSSEKVDFEMTRIREDRTIRHVVTTHAETSDYICKRVSAFVAEACGIAGPEEVRDEGC